MIKGYLNKKHIKICTVIYLIFFVICMALFFVSRGKEVYSNNIEYFIEAGDVEKNIAEGISLYPGLYSAEVTYDLETDDLYGGFIYVYDDNVRARGLESTGGPLYQGKNTAEAGFKYLDHTNSFRVTIKSFNDDISVSSIKIVNTGKLWTVGAFLLTVFYLALITTSVFVSMLRDGKISQNRMITILVMLIVWFLMMLPMFYQNTLSTADDGYHKQRIEGVVAALKAFIIPTRIEPHWVQGYGYANGIFYCDIFLVFPALLRMIGLSVTAAYNWYISAVCLAILLVSFYSYNKIFKREHIALILTILYSTSIMRYYKLISTGALGEGTAIIFLPLVLLGLYEIFYTDNPEEDGILSFVHLGIGSAGLVLCHILSTTITIGVIAIFLLINIRYLFKKRNLILTILSGFMAFVLSAWFVIPFVEYYFLEDIHIKHVYDRTIQFLGLYFPQAIALFYSSYGDKIAYVRGMYHCYSQGIGLLLFIAVAIMVPICIKGIFKKSKSVTRFTIHMTFLACLYFTFSMIEFPWDRIQALGGPAKALISSVQFPGRLLEWGIVFAVASTGCLLIRLSEEYKTNALRIVIPIIAILTVIGYLYHHDMYMPETKQYYIENSEGIGNGYTAGAEYKPEGTDENLCIYNRTDSSEGVTISNFVPGPLKGSMYVDNSNSNEGWVEFPLLKYRGYKAFDSLGNRLDIVYGYNNVIRVMVPGNYKGEIRVRFVSPIYWRLAELFSLAGFILMCVYISRVNNMKEKRDESIKENKVEVSEKLFSEKMWLILLALFALLVSYLPYATGYVSEGTYINEALAPFIVMENSIGVRAEVFYFSTLILILLITYSINFYVVKKVVALFGIQKRETSVVSGISLLVYYTSPIVLYTLFNRNAIWDWACILLLPAIVGEFIIVANKTKRKDREKVAVDLGILVLSLVTVIVTFISSNGIIKDYDTLSISVRISKLFDMFPNRGAYNLGLYLGNPVQLPIVFVSITIITIAVALLTKGNQSASNQYERKLYIILGIGVAITLIATIPGISTIYPHVILRLIGPQTLIAVAGVIMMYDIPLFKLFIDNRVKDDQYRLILYVVLISIVVLSAIFQVNDIAYDSPGIRMVLHSTN